MCDRTKRWTEGPYPQKFLYPMTENFSPPPTPPTHTPSFLRLHVTPPTSSWTPLDLLMRSQWRPLRKIRLVTYEFNPPCFATVCWPLVRFPALSRVRPRSFPLFGGRTQAHVPKQRLVIKPKLATQSSKFYSLQHKPCHKRMTRNLT